MFDPLTVILVGAGALAFREFNKKDFGILTPSRDERYRQAMEHCHNPAVLKEEAKLFAEYGLKAQAAMLNRRADWRARPDNVKQMHEELYQKALKSTNIAAILEFADGLEWWTATKKAATLRERVQKLQAEALEKAAQEAAEAATALAQDLEKTAQKVGLHKATPKDGEVKSNGVKNGHPAAPFTGIIDTTVVTGEDDT